MKPTETKIIKIWQDVADTLGGELSISYQQVNGGQSSGGLYLVRIDKLYQGVNIQIHAGFLELPLTKDEYDSGDITITATKKNSDIVELSIWRKDFLDRIFSSGISKTGYKKFDKVIGLKATKNLERNIHRVFKDESLREEFIEDKFRAYNIQTIEGFITIRRKSSLMMKNAKMFIIEYERFIRFIDGLINARIV